MILRSSNLQESAFLFLVLFFGYAATSLLPEGFLWIHGGREWGLGSGGGCCYFLAVVRRLCIVGGFSLCGEQALEHMDFSGCGGQA